MPNDRALAIAGRASLIGGGLLAGVALTVLALELALRGLDGPGYVRVRQAEFGYFTWFIGAVTVLTFAAVALLVVLARREGTRTSPQAVAALVLLVVAAAVSVAVNGPINVEQLGWDAQAPPVDWASVRDRWQIAHAVRTVAIVAALGCLSAADRRGALPRRNVGGRS